MKLVYAAITVLHLLVLSVQGQSIPSLPSCANSCVSQVCTNDGYATTFTCFCDLAVNITHCIGSNCDTSDKSSAVTALDSACGLVPLTIRTDFVAYFNYSSPLSSLSSGISTASRTAGGTGTTATSGSSSTSTAKSSGSMMSKGGLVAVGISVSSTIIGLLVYYL